MRKERKILRFVPQKLRKSFANGNPSLEQQSQNNNLPITAIRTHNIDTRNIFI